MVGGSRAFQAQQELEQLTKVMLAVTHPLRLETTAQAVVVAQVLWVFWPLHLPAVTVVLAFRQALLERL